MKRNSFSDRKSPKLPIAWREAERAMRKANAVSTCDDCVSEEIFDIEDERAEVGIIVQSMVDDLN